MLRHYRTHTFLGPLGVWIAAASVRLTPLIAVSIMVHDAAGQTRGVYPDDSVAARDALVRVRELHAAGNTAEAVRVLQSILDTEAEKLLAVSDDTEVLHTVRDAAHELLVATPVLLAAYAADHEHVAAELVAAGELARVERTMLMTDSGFEAALRLAQLEVEASRFDSALLMLEQLDRHPARLGAAKSPRAKESNAAQVARLARALSQFLPRAEPLAERWLREAQLNIPLGPAFTWPGFTRERGRTPLEVGPSPKSDGAGSSPLQSVQFDPDRPSETDDASDSFMPMSEGSFVFPTVLNGRVYATDGMHLSAWDASTLTPIWSICPTGRSLAGLAKTDDSQSQLFGGRTAVQDPTTVAISQGIAVFAGGVAINDGRMGDDNNIHAVDATTGEPLWTVNASLAESQKFGGREANTSVAIRGNLVIDADTIVVSMRKVAQLKHINSIQLVGLDLHTGAVKWSRLLGSCGTTPWSRAVARSEGLALRDGVVFRVDEMGIAAAVEAATGRIRWVRLLPTRTSFDFTMRPDDEAPPHAMHTAIFGGDTLFLIEPRLIGTSGRVIGLNPADGSLKASRVGNVLASPRYLIAAGEYLGAVGDERIAFVKFNDLATGTVRMSDPYARLNILGRATVLEGGKVALPLTDAIVTIDPADPSASERTVVTYSGNVLVADRDDGVGEHFILADNRGVHTYLEWRQAQQLLEKRIKASPKNPAPLLTYVDLCGRVGRPEMIPQLSDSALAIIDSLTDPDAASASRSRLYDILSDTVVQSRRGYSSIGAPAAPAAGAEAVPDGKSEGEPSSRQTFLRPPVRDLAILDQIMDRLDRAAESPLQSASAHFERAWLRGVQKRYANAVEALQAVLLDDSYEDVKISADDALDAVADAGQPASPQPVRSVAKARLAALLTAQGPGAYAAFDDECGRAAAALGADAEAAKFERLARSYPCAATTASLWRSAGSQYRKAGNQESARRAFGSGIAAAELSAAIGRADQSAALGALAGELASLNLRAGDQEPMYRLMKRLASDYPDAAFAQSVTMPPALGGAAVGRASEFAAAILPRLEQRRGLAEVGAKCLPNVQALAAWAPVSPLTRHPGTSASGLIMIQESQSQMGFWATDALDGQLRPVWRRRFDAKPVPVRVTPDVSWIFTPSSSGGVLEAIANTGGKARTGTTIWKTQEFGSLFPPSSGDGEGRFKTPLHGNVSESNVLIACNATRICLVQQRGAAACFDAATGKLLWSKMLEPTRIFDIEIVGDYLMSIGTFLSKNDGNFRALAVSNKLEDGADGSRLTNVQLGDHPRWLRAIDQSDVLIGAASGLLRFNPQTGVLVWSTPGEPARSSAGAWIVGDQALLLTNDAQLYHVALAKGEVDHAAVDTQGRLMFPLSGVVNDRTLAISASKGLTIIGEHGELLGVDGLAGSPAMEPAPEFGRRIAYAIESEVSASEDEPLTLRLFCFELPSGRLLNIQRMRLGDSPTSLTLIDGKLVMACGSLTLVIDAPAETQ